MYLAHGVARRDAEPHGKSRRLQRAGDGVLCQLGRVVLLGKVREQDVARAALHGKPRKFRRRVVGQVPFVAENAALEEIGVGAVLQRFHVVIGFEQEHIHARERFTRRVGDEAGVGQDAERAVGGVDALIDWDAKSPEIDLMRYMDDKRAKEDKLFDHPELMKTPIVRNGKQATTGYRPDVWETWE